MEPPIGGEHDAERRYVECPGWGRKRNDGSWSTIFKSGHSSRPEHRQTVIPVTSFQIATHPLAASVRDSILPDDQGVADTRRLLLYFRKDHEGRLVMGGRYPVDDDPMIKDAAALKTAMARVFPQAVGSPIQFV